MTSHTDTAFVSPSRLNLFDVATALMRRGEYSTALELWNTLLDGEQAAQGSDVITGHLLGVAGMRRAKVLMMLGYLEHARRDLEMPLMRLWFPKFSAAEQMEFCMAYGTLLGELGNVDGMSQVMAHALGLVARHLNEPSDSVIRLWTQLICVGVRAQEWTIVLRECRWAQLFADSVGDLTLRVTATLHRAEAHLALGDKRQARQEAEWLRQTAIWVEEPQLVARAEGLLALL